jgi:hypothetical protein
MSDFEAMITHARSLVRNSDDSRIATRCSNLLRQHKVLCNFSNEIRYGWQTEYEIKLGIIKAMRENIAELAELGVVL